MPKVAYYKKYGKKSKKQYPNGIWHYYYKSGKHTTNYDYEVNAKPFYGIEGERLIYKWIPISQLGKVELYPDF
ncbi:hypothetical protein [uncultured Rummeliibacillus sp.]|uniref:hypothetical protein n=1 Tax=uncultured Rummeliibacillus sp. TaxID=762292 RepID=UPI0026080052|nr:hypothetical protein [uncultured Rummeliibacillus sp.]